MRSKSTKTLGSCRKGRYLFGQRTLILHFAKVWKEKRVPFSAVENMTTVFVRLLPVFVCFFNSQLAVAGFRLVPIEGPIEPVVPQLP